MTHTDIRRPNPRTDLTYYTDEWCRQTMTTLLERHPRPWSLAVLRGAVRIIDAQGTEVTSHKFICAALATAVNRYGNPWR